VDEFLTATISGVCIAAIFAMAATGLVLTYTTTGIFNFAHGAIGMLGAFAYWQLHEDWGWPVLVSLAVVLLVLAPLLGVAIELVVMRNLNDVPEIARLVVTISLLAALVGLGLWLWSPQRGYPMDRFFDGEVLRIGGVNVTYHEIAGLVVIVVVAAGLRALLYRTRTGLAMRAAVDDRNLAMLNGARPDRSALLAWAIGCSLAALAGIFIAPDVGVAHINLTLLIVNAYAAAMIGRLRSFPLTFLGALILGLADAYWLAYQPQDNQYVSQLRFGIPVILLFVVLVFVPPARLRGTVTGRAREVIPLPSWRTAIVVASAVVAVSLVLTPMLGEADALRASKIVALAVIALSLVPIVGFGGMPVLCPMSFAGIGALVYSHNAPAGEPWALVLAAVVAGAAGALVALPVLRLSGIELALATAAFAVALDRWVFLLDPFDLGPLTIRFFGFGSTAVTPVDVPGVESTDRDVQLVLLATAFAVLYLVVVAVRRSGFGMRLLALKTSPAAAATLGLDLRRLRLGVFALSGAMAGVGGALYGSTLGSISPETFSFFQSLPLLLLAVVGGIGSASGALFAGAVLGGAPILITTWPAFQNPNRVLPGMMGIGLGRNPNGAVSDMAEAYRPVAAVRSVLLSALGIGALLLALRGAGVVTSWTLVIGVVAVLLAAPAAAGAMFARRQQAGGAAPRALPLEHAGVDRPFTADEVAALDAELALPAVTP
jgi:branched-chain amino acid transport system permease protein